MSYSAYQSRQSVAEAPTDLEFRAFAFVTGLLDNARDDAQRITALHKNHQLWSILLTDLAAEGNQLPRELKARLVSLADWSMGYSLRAMNEPLPLQPLIDVNREIAGGLSDQKRARAAGQAAEPPVTTA